MRLSLGTIRYRGKVELRIEDEELKIKSEEFGGFTVAEK